MSDHTLKTNGNAFRR